MPIYEYECKKCKEIKEVIQRITDEPLTTCPDCFGKLKKLVSVSAFHLKGGGWYADGYSNNSNGVNSSPKKTSINGKTKSSVKEPAKDTVTAKETAASSSSKDNSSASTSAATFGT